MEGSGECSSTGELTRVRSFELSIEMDVTEILRSRGVEVAEAEEGEGEVTVKACKRGARADSVAAGGRTGGAKDVDVDAADIVGS